MILRVLFWTVALGVAIPVAQTPDGQIAGASTTSRAPLFRAFA